MEHIDWVDTDNIVIANITSSNAYKKMIGDIQSNGIKTIRLLKNDDAYYFRYVVGDEICWFRLSHIPNGGKPDFRKGILYTHIHQIFDQQWKIDKLNNLHKEFDRDDKLNKLLGDE